MSGRLWVVATPIGNLEDITLRAIRILREADGILAEDTRHTKKLCVHHGVSTPLRSFHAHTSRDKLDAIVTQLRSGARLALVSDAGTPLVSDPGRELVEACRDAEVPVEVVPGPSAVMAALSIAGIPASNFRFFGFLPRSGGRRREALCQIAEETHASVFFEAPRRVIATLEELAALQPSRRAAICRELTKVHETVHRGTLAELAQSLGTSARGEITVVVAEMTDAAVPSEETVEALIHEAKQRGRPPSEAARELAKQTGLSRTEAYRRLLDSE